MKNRKLIAYAMCLTLTATSACGIFRGENAALIWPTALDCTTQQIPRAVSELVDTLLVKSNDPSQEQSVTDRLTGLAEKYGTSVLSCAVSRFVAGARTVGASSDPVILHAADFGEQYLDSMGVETATQD